MIRLYRKDGMLKKFQREWVADVPLRLRVDNEKCAFAAGACGNLLPWLQRLTTMQSNSGPKFTVELTLGNTLTVCEAFDVRLTAPLIP